MKYLLLLIIISFSSISCQRFLDWDDEKPVHQFKYHVNDVTTFKQVLNSDCLQNKYKENNFGIVLGTWNYKEPLTGVLQYLYETQEGSTFFDKFLNSEQYKNNSKYIELFDKPLPINEPVQDIINAMIALYFKKPRFHLAINVIIPKDLSQNEIEKYFNWMCDLELTIRNYGYTLSHGYSWQLAQNDFNRFQQLLQKKQNIKFYFMNPILKQYSIKGLEKDLILNPSDMNSYHDSLFDVSKTNQTIGYTAQQFKDKVNREPCGRGIILKGGLTAQDYCDFVDIIKG